MARPLPMKLWLTIEDDVIRHKAEIAQAFADARERLLPEPPTPERMTEAEIRDAHARWQMQAMTNNPAWLVGDPRTGAVIWEPQASGHGLFGWNWMGW